MRAHVLLNEFATQGRIIAVVLSLLLIGQGIAWGQVPAAAAEVFDPKGCSPGARALAACNEASPQNTPATSSRQTAPNGQRASSGGGPSLEDLIATQNQLLSDWRDSVIENAERIEQERQAEQTREQALLERDDEVVHSIIAADQAAMTRTDRQDVINDFADDARDIDEELAAESVESTAPNISLNNPQAVDEALSDQGLPTLLQTVNDDDSDSHGPLFQIATQELDNARESIAADKDELAHPLATLASDESAEHAVDSLTEHASPESQLTESADNLKRGVETEVEDLVRSGEDEGSSPSIGSWIRDKVVDVVTNYATNRLRDGRDDLQCGDSEHGSLGNSYCRLFVAANPMNLSKGPKPYLSDVEAHFETFFGIATSQSGASTENP